MAKHDHTLIPSTRGAMLAVPLRTFLAKSPQPEPAIDAITLLRELIANAGVLEDAAPGGERFVLAVLPPDLLEALAAFVAVPVPAPMPLFDRVAL